MLKTDKLKITSKFGWRKFFRRKHKGVDLRSWNDKSTSRLDVVLPEECIYMVTVHQEKWGYTHIFEGVESGIKFKFIHVDNRIMKDVNPGKVLKKGFVIGHTYRTEYMKDYKTKKTPNGLGEHLHFETWKNGKAIDPVKYFKNRGVDYE